MFFTRHDRLRHARIESLLQQILTNTERIIVMDQATTDLLKRLDDATNKIAAKLQALVDKATASGSATAAEIDAALSPEIAKLEGLASDPANPVPAAPATKTP
jgi:hypothetical protein